MVRMKKTIQEPIRRRRFAFIFVATIGRMNPFPLQDRLSLRTDRTGDDDAVEPFCHAVHLTMEAIPTRDGMLHEEFHTIQGDHP